MTFTTRSIPRSIAELMQEQRMLGMDVIGPQPGPQEYFLSSPARITVMGGAAGGGKTFAQLLKALRYAALQPKPGYQAIIFRRVKPQITMPGGLWDEAEKLYTLFGGKPNYGEYKWTWPHYGTSISFAAMQYERDKYKWQGSQAAYIGFEELTHYCDSQFWYLLSRARTMSGVVPQITATTNPDADSWVKVFLSPWVDAEYDGPGGRAESGELRWFVRDGNALRWLAPGEYHPDAMSVTFIASRITDNPALLKADPGYLSALKALPHLERQRLLYGDWSARNPGTMFRRHWFPIIDAPPPTSEMVGVVRFWDLAATTPSKENPDPDWTAGVKIAKLKDNRYVILDVRRERYSSAKVKELVRRTADQDGHNVKICMEQEPGSSGKTLIEYYRREVLAGFHFAGILSTGDKETRAKPMASLAEGNNIALVRAHWNDTLLTEFEAFPTKDVHDDTVDAAAGAMSQLFTRSAQWHVDWSKRLLEMRRGK